MDPHSFFADPDQAVFLNADPDPDPGSLKFVKKSVEKDQKGCSEVKKPWSFIFTSVDVLNLRSSDCREKVDPLGHSGWTNLDVVLCDSTGATVHF